MAKFKTKKLAGRSYVSIGNCLSGEGTLYRSVPLELPGLFTVKLKRASESAFESVVHASRTAEAATANNEPHCLNEENLF